MGQRTAALNTRMRIQISGENSQRKYNASVAPPLKILARVYQPGQIVASFHPRPAFVVYYNLELRPANEASKKADVRIHAGSSTSGSLPMKNG